MSLLPAALTALALASPCAIAAMPVPDFTALDRLIEDTRRATGYAPGLAIVVLRDGRIVHEAYSGHADIDAQVPVTRDTVFYIASATKPMFALNALLAEADGRLDLQTPLRTMFPDVAFDGIDADVVTAGELLFHASGVDNPDLAWAAAFSGVHDAASRQALVARTHADPETPHRTFRYTNVGYNLFSAWLDRRSATPWQQQLEARVFQPLGMHHTSASMDHAQRAGWTLAQPYSLGSITPQRPLPLSKTDATMHAAGGVVSTAPDLARFLAAQLSGGDSCGIPRALIARSQQPQVAVDAHYQDFARDGYAWGWYTGAYKGQRLLHHFGSFAGFHAHLSFMPDAGLALVVLANEDVLAPRLTSLVADYAYGTLLHEPDLQARVAARFDALQAQALALPSTIARQRAQIAARPWRLALPRAAYGGRYEDPLLGTITVTLDADARLRLRWGVLDAVADGGDADEQLRVEFMPGAGRFLDFDVQDGRVIAIDFEGMRFQRLQPLDQPDPRPSAPAR